MLPMLLEHYVVAQESVSDHSAIMILTIAGSVPFVVSLVVLLGVVPGTVGQGTLLLLLAGAVGCYFVGWRIPIRYVLTDTHLLLTSGLLHRCWVPIDQIHIICQTSRDDELIYSGFRALGDRGQPVMINPHLPPQFRVTFTPSGDFIKSLFWVVGRQEFDLWPDHESAESEGLP